MNLKKLAKEYNYLKERQKGDYTAIEKAWDNLSYDEQMNIIADAMNGEPRPNDYEKGFDQLKSEIPDFESAIANYVGIDEIAVDGKEVDTGTIELGGTEMIQRYGIDDALPDIFASEARFTDGTKLNDEQLSKLTDDYPETIEQIATGQMEEGTCGYAPGGEVDVHNTDKMTPAGPNMVKIKIREIINKELKSLKRNK